MTNAETVSRAFLLALALNIIEFVVFILICTLYSTIYELSTTDIYGDFVSSDEMLRGIEWAFREAFSIAVFRVVLYSYIWVLVIIAQYTSVTKKVTPLRLAIFNCLIYVCVSVLICVVMDAFWNVFLSIVFFGFVFTTLVSPFILAKIPIVNNLINLSLREESQD